MRAKIGVVAVLIPLAGCVVAPEPAGYGYIPPAYAQPQPAYGGPPAYADESVYPGYVDYGGSPALTVDGAIWPLIFFGGGWGYWDGEHRWHRAPEQVWRHLERRYPRGEGLRGPGGYRPGFQGGLERPRPGYGEPVGRPANEWRGRQWEEPRREPAPGFYQQGAPRPAPYPQAGYQPRPAPQPGFYPGQPARVDPRASYAPPAGFQPRPAGPPPVNLNQPARQQAPEQHRDRRDEQRR